MSLIHQATTLVAVIQSWILLLHKRAAMRAAYPDVSYGPMLQRDQERIANLNWIYNRNDVEVVQMLRMRRAPFYELVKRFRERGLLSDSIHTTVEEQVAMFLHVVGHNQRSRVMHNTFRRSIETISRYFNQVLYAIGELRQEKIKPPSGDIPSKIRYNKRWYPYFKVSWNSHLHTHFELCNAHNLDSLSIIIMIGLHWGN
jgi:hypothetical protein